VFEKSELERCQGKSVNIDEIGIWDILGYYDGNAPTPSIHLCEREIEDTVSEFYHNRSRFTKLSLRFVVRELVRLHEHAHALIHIGDFKRFNELVKKYPESYIPPFNNYGSFPPIINEPLTEFISWSTISYLKDTHPYFLKIFNKIDKKAPHYYREWRRIRKSIDKINKPITEYIYYIPGLVKIARENKWTNFEDFLKEILKNEKILITIATIYIFM